MHLPEYTVDYVAWPDEVIVTAVKPLGPNEPRHEQITATVSPEVARRARALQGKLVHLHVNSQFGREYVVDIVAADATEAN